MNTQTTKSEPAPLVSEAPSAAIPAMPAGVRQFTLENGLTLIVREDHSAPVVSAQAWCQSGSVHEGRWLGAGLSHVLEHMLFKGTATRPGSRIDQEVQDAGGQMNAYTSFDRTVYHIDVPNTGARVAVDILCDIMQNAALPAEELAKEKEVILREMDMNQDDPGRRAGRRLFETAYTRSPYRYTIIGYPDIYNEITREDVVTYYRERYVPNNVFFVVVGDIKADEVLAQVTAGFAKAKARSLPSMVLPEEPAQTAPREVIEEAPIELGHFHMSWHIPDVRHPDVPILDVLAVILGNGRSSRLFQKVRERLGVVHSVDAWTYNPGSSGLFGVSAVVDGNRFEAARDAILAEIIRATNEPATSAEVAKAVKQFVSATLSARKTMQGQAQDLGGNWLAANDLNFSQRYLAAVRRVTPDELRRVARKYLTVENQTLYALLPKGAAPRAAVSSDSTQDHGIRKFELKNGLRLLVKEDHRLPFVQFRAVLRGGVLCENLSNSGLTTLMARMLLKGTPTRTAERIATEIESVGGSLDSYGGNNSLGVQAEVLSSDFETGIDLVADVLRHPAFPAAAIEREREVQLAGIRSQRDHLLHSCARSMRKTMFGDRGYGLDASGTEESVARLSRTDLELHHRNLVVPSNCVLAIYGDIVPEAARDAVEESFGDWQGSGAIPAPPECAALNAPRRVVETRDKKQLVLVIGFPGTTLANPDRCALDILHEACSDLGSRLFVRIRDQLGLAYYVGAQNFPGVTPGYFTFYVGTAPEHAELAEKELLEQAGILRTEGLTEAELVRAKAKILGHKKIARQDLGGLASTTALDELLGFGYGHFEEEDALYEAVTLEQVREAARKYLRPDACVVAIVRPG